MKNFRFLSLFVVSCTLLSCHANPVGNGTSSNSTNTSDGAMEQQNQQNNLPYYYGSPCGSGNSMVFDGDPVFMVYFYQKMQLIQNQSQQTTQLPPKKD